MRVPPPYHFDPATMRVYGPGLPTDGIDELDVRMGHIPQQVPITPETHLILNEVLAEVKRARSKHPTPMHSKHEGYAILLEEVDEVQTEVFHGKDKKALYAELIQVAAMAVRMIEDCKL